MPHRAHASTEGVTHYLKSAAGFLLEKEIEYLGNAVQDAKKPFMVILGGAKVSDKIGVIENLLPKCDAILIGGGMSYTFLKAKGKSIGNSKLEKEKLDVAKNILDKARIMKKDIVLPIDHLVVDNIDPQAKTEIVGEDIPEGKIAVDIGPKTIALFKDKLKAAKTIVWNGPLGIFEMDAFSKGTKEIAQFIARLKATTIIGGGDTGADCVGTAHRQGAKCVVQIELLAKPPECRTPDYPWPKYPLLCKTSTSHEEGGIREWSVSTKKFSGRNGKVKKLLCSRVAQERADREFEIEADLVILALGFLHPEHNGLVKDLGLELDTKGNVKTDENYMTKVPGVFSAGDMHRGQSLVVWAISEGRKAAYCIDKYLMGRSNLPVL